MTKEEVELWLELGKLAASIATPIAVVSLGIFITPPDRGHKGHSRKAIRVSQEMGGAIL